MPRKTEAELPMPAHATLCRPATCTFPNVVDQSIGRPFGARKKSGPLRSAKRLVVGLKSPFRV
jgi:hypothetical protein